MSYLNDFSENLSSKISPKRAFSFRFIMEVSDLRFGVYIIWAAKNCVYVGETTRQSLRKRLKTHYDKSHNSRLNLWIRSSVKLDFQYIELDDPNETKNLEKYLIKKLSPQCNIKNNSTK